MQIGLDPPSTHCGTLVILFYIQIAQFYGLPRRKIALSTSEVEYIVLSNMLCEVIALTNLLKELHTKGFSGRLCVELLKITIVTFKLQLTTVDALVLNTCPFVYTIFALILEKLLPSNICPQSFS